MEDNASKLDASGQPLDLHLKRAHSVQFQQWEWELEPNPEIVRRLGKLGEELAELSAVCFRAIIQGVDEVDLNSQLANRKRLEDEIADVYCQLNRTVERMKLDKVGMDVRCKRKAQQMELWEGMY